MKRFLVTIVTLMIFALFLTGCGAQPTQAYVKIGNEWKNVSVKSWCEGHSDVLHLTLQDGTELFIHASNCILYDGTLPIKK